MFEPDSTPSPSQTKPPRWDRAGIAAEIAAYEAMPHREISQRQFADERGVPRTTLQYWLARKTTIDADPGLIAFMESPVGLAFLHRLTIALHLAFTQVGPSGIRQICLFLELSELDRFIAASYGSQQQLSQRMQAGIGEFGTQEQSRLAQNMSPGKITICEDETFHPETCLVAIEPVSNFILVEQYADRRDAKTWDQAVEQALKGLPVEVIQSTGDEARGILAHVRDGLAAHHSPDLFHAQQELHKATSLPLQAQVSQASRQVEEAEQRSRRAEEAFELSRQQPPKPGRPPDFPQRIAQAREAETEARQSLEACQTRLEQMREAIQEIGAVYHPYDPANARALPADEVGRRVEEQFARIDRLAEEACLSNDCLARIEKARRLIKSFVATIAFFHLRVRLWVSELALVPEVEQAVLNELIPALYLQRAAKTLPTAEARTKAAAVPETILARLRGPTGILGALSSEERARVERVARECADLFQRSSSCVEGRNGQLTLRHHSLHRLPRGKLKALTVVHNYFVTRSDGTTAAERFFGAKPADLFSWLLDRLDVPARPAAKRSKILQKAA